MKTCTRITLFVVAVFSFSSCFVAKTDKIIQRYYENNPVSGGKKKADTVCNFAIKPDISGNIYSVSHRKSKVLVPAPPIAFIMQTAIVTNLNAKIPVDIFLKNFYQPSVYNGLKQKLQQKKLEITIDSVPNIISQNDKAYWFLLVGWDKLYWKMENNSLAGHYKIFENNQVIKQGQIQINQASLVKGMIDKNYIVWQKFVSVKDYLAYYETVIAGMAKAFTEQLALAIDDVEK